MELKAVRLFVALADELHFSRAAKRAGVTQSVLSVQIRRLEDVLGAPLFTRTTREVKLTDVGRTFREEADGILRRVDEAIRAARMTATGGGRLIRIGITSAAEVSRLMDRIASFRAARPDTQILIRELGTVEQEVALTTGDINIGILHPPLDYPDLVAEEIHVEPFFAVYHPSFFRLADPVSWRDLFGHPLVFYPRRRAPRLYAGLIGFARENKLAAHIATEAESFLSAVAMARAGLGVALLPRRISEFQTGLTVAPLPSDNPFSLATAVAVHRSQTEDHAIRACVTALKDPAGLPNPT